MKKLHKKIIRSQARTLQRMFTYGNKDRMKFPFHCGGGIVILYTRKERSEIYKRNGRFYRDLFGTGLALKHLSDAEKAKLMRNIWPKLLKLDVVDTVGIREKEGRQHRIYGGWYEMKIWVAEHFGRKAGL